MTERRPWTPQQDKALKYLKDVVKVLKWSQISRRLQFEFKISGRNGKQCRQRYTNHLDDSIDFTEFTWEEEQKLFRLHDLIGNKWSQICRDFSGRTQNQIKNHFHSRLRKAIRKLNKQIKQNFKKTINPYKLSIVYKIVEASDFRFFSNQFICQENLDFFNDLKKILIQFAGGFVQQKTEISSLKRKESVQFLVQKMAEFQSHQKKIKPLFSAKGKNKRVSKIKVYKGLKVNSLTKKLEHANSAQIDKQREEISESEIIYEEMSFQFIRDANLTEVSFKPMEEEQTDSQTDRDVDRNYLNNKVNGKTSKESGNFINCPNEMQKLIYQFPDIINRLAQEEQFPEELINGKLSIKQFQSLKDFQDNYLNDSEISIMLKRFESFSSFDSGLFQ